MTGSTDRPNGAVAIGTPAADDGVFAAELALGMELYRAREYDRAADGFQRLAQRQGDHPVILRMLGLCRVRSGDLEQGAQLLARAHALAPNDPETRLHYGIALLALGRAGEAATFFRSCIAVMPLDPAPSLNLAAALLQLGDLTGAMLAARRAKLRAPKMAEVHYTLGLAKLASGALEAAAMAFRTAIALAPGFAEAWVNLGIVRYRQDNIMAARDAMSRALAAVPGHSAATASLAVFLRLTGEMEQAEALLRGALEAGGNTAEVRINLAASELAEDRPAEALSLLDGPPPRDPRLALHWHLQRVLALLQLDRIGEARALLDRLDAVPAPFEPLLYWRRVLLALANGDLPSARGAAARMEEVLEDVRDVLPEHRIIGYFDLARFWASRNDHDRAFAHWTRGHRRLAGFQPFSRPDFRAFVDASIQHFDRARLHAGPRARNVDAAPVFIVGMPRSGTTLAEQILAAHREIHGAGERNALARAFEALGGAMESTAAVRRVAALDGEALEAAAAGYLGELHALAPDATRIVDKMPGNFRHLGLIALMLPGARIVHCVRDPRDVALSIFTYRFYGYHPYAHDIADLGWYIGQYHRLMKHWAGALPNPMLVIRLQDWVEDFDSALRRLLAFLDLPYDSACERFYEVERRIMTASRQQVKSPINARGLGRWRGYARHLEPVVEELRHAGIDPDRVWP